MFYLYVFVVQFISATYSGYFTYTRFLCQEKELCLYLEQIMNQDNKR